jgi:hypothetical protein
MELTESTLRKKYQRDVSVCKDFGLNVNLDKCMVMKMSQKTGDMEEIKCNNCEIKTLRASSPQELK